MSRGRSTRPRRHREGSHAGYTLIELLAVLAVIAIVAAIAIPSATTGLARSQGFAAARYLGARVAMTRLQAVTRSANVALRFEEVRGDIAFAVFVDGNANGVRTRDIEAGIDRQIEPPIRLADLFPGVVIGLAPQIPGTDPVQIGPTNLLSFTPQGTATPGTVYIRGRDDTQWAVRVLGATARARVLRYVTATGQWVEAY